MLLLLSVNGFAFLLSLFAQIPLHSCSINRSLLGIIIVAVTLNPGESPSYHNYLTTQSSYDSDMDHTPILRSRRKTSMDYDCDNDSGGEYGPNDMCADTDNLKWDAEAQVSSFRS